MAPLPPEPPFEPDAPTPPPALDVPLAPPEVGFGSPWAPADGENRDRILDWWRMWWRRVFFPWVIAWTAYWDAQWTRLALYINTWISAADEYIIEHAIAGYSFRTTATPIAATGTTDVVITVGEDTDHRPLVVGDLVVDETQDSRFGVITVVIDDTHATVAVLGAFKGYAGHGWWVTATVIAHAGTTAVILPIDATRIPQVGDIVVDSSASAAWGAITIVTDATHATVAYIGTLQGPIGPQGDPGDPGPQGDPGLVQAVIAGDNITVDSTDPANPIVSAGSAGSSLVETVVAGDNIAVDSTDPANPIVSAVGVVNSVVAGDNVAVDSTDPANPIVIVDGAGFAGAPIDPNLEIQNLSDRYGIVTTAGTHYGVDMRDTQLLLRQTAVTIGGADIELGPLTGVDGGGISVTSSGVDLGFYTGGTLRTLIHIGGSGLAFATGSGSVGYLIPPNLPGESITPPKGAMYFNTADNTLRVFDGTIWNTLTMTPS